MNKKIKYLDEEEKELIESYDNVDYKKLKKPSNLIEGFFM